MKSLFKAVFSLYLLVLLWLVLFKTSLDFSAVLDHQVRSLNLIPFMGISQSNLREMLDNLIVFIPFGLLLSVNFKRITVWQKLTYVFIFSVAVEMIQFILSIGVADITDVIMNTLGGFFGLMIYSLGNTFIKNEKLDWIIVVVNTILLVLFLLLRFLVFKVKY